MKELLEIWKIIKEAVLEYLRNTEFLSLLAHGSYAEGVANETSDFDLLVLCGEDVREREDVILVRDIEVNITFIHKETILKQLESLDNLLSPSKIGSAIPITCRLKNAVILIDKEDCGKKLVEKVREVKPSENLMDWYSKAGLNHYYDAVGAIVSEDYATSVHMARLGALQVMTGIMLGHGDLYVKQKWYVRLLERIPAAPKEVFLRLMGLNTADKKEAECCIRDLKTLISELQILREEQ